MIDWDRIHAIESFLNKEEKVAVERSKRYKDDVSYLLSIIRSFKEEDWKFERRKELEEIDERKIRAMDDIIKLLDNNGLYASCVPRAES